MSAYMPVDAKLIVMDWLKTELDAPVVSTRPDQAGRPARFVRVIATGGQGRHSRVLQTSQVTIDSYAETPARAMALALRVDTAMHAAVHRTGLISAVSGTSPAEFPDPDTGQARATTTYQVTVRPKPNNN